jgi:hypothetical protein
MSQLQAQTKGRQELPSGVSPVMTLVSTATTGVTNAEQIVQALGKGTNVVTKPVSLSEPVKPLVMGAEKVTNKWTYLGVAPPKSQPLTAPARGILKTADGAVPQNVQKTVRIASQTAEMSKTVRVLGGVSGGLTVATGLLEIGVGVHTLINDHPQVALGKTMLRRAKHLYDLDHECADAKELYWRCVDMLKRLVIYQKTEGWTGVGFGSSNVGAGTTMIVGAAIGGPVTLAVGGTLAAGVGVFSGFKTVGCSFRDYSIRAEQWEQVKEITHIRQRLGQVGSPCKINLSGSRWCQIYAIIEYVAYDGETVELMSCDHDNAYNWYECNICLEPDISNLKIKFDVRGGSEVSAVDRSLEALPWRRIKDGVWRESSFGSRKGRTFQEVFKFPSHAGKTLNFKCNGPSLDAYVESAYDGQKPIRGHPEAYDAAFPKLLGINDNASAAQIKRSFKRLSLTRHPDKGGNAEEFRKIDEAHQVLLEVCENFD